jgi:alpha-ketoglutarate-dependent 2,4-dichlorophenoxyacetate dioxygenase
MPVVVASIPGAFAGEATGIDCAAPLNLADVRAIDAAMERHAVIVFHGHKLTDEQQIAFTKNFGDLERYETPGHIRKREEERLGRDNRDRRRGAPSLLGHGSRGHRRGPVSSPQTR